MDNYRVETVEGEGKKHVAPVCLFTSRRHPRGQSQSPSDSLDLPPASSASLVMLGLPGRVLGLMGGAAPLQVFRRGRRVLSRRPVRVHLKGEEKETQDVLKRYEDMFRAAQRTPQGTGGYRRAFKGI